MRVLGLLALLILATSMLALTGCTLVNPVDYGRLDSGMDTMVDSGDDGDTGDGGPDGGDGDAGDACSDRPEICDDGVDNNCNGLIDCNDFGCGQLERCCDRPRSRALPYGGSLWQRIPSTATRDPQMDGSNITGFVGDDLPTGYLTQSCLPLEAGYEITTTFTLQDETCTVGFDCFARIALTPVPDSASGTRITADLGVEMRTDATLIVTGGAQMGEVPPILAGPLLVGPRMAVDVTITLTAGTYPPDTNGFLEPALLATVTAVVGGGGTSKTVLLDGHPIAPLSTLLSAPGTLCRETQGLLLAVEGEGSQIKVSEVRVAELQCLNLGRFEIPAATDGREALSAGGEDASVADLGWAAWGSSAGASEVGAPAILFREGVWHVFGDATDQDRGEEVASALAFRASHSTASEFNWSDPWNTTGSYKFGPTCSANCWSDDISVREPSVVDTGNPVNFTMATAVRVDPASPDEYGIDLSTPNIALGDVHGSARIDILPQGGCHSLRHPALVPRDATGSTGYWLFFACETALEVFNIQVLKLTPGLAVDTTFPQQIVIDREAGTFRATAVYAPEVLVDYDETGNLHTFRMWFLARNVGRKVSVGLAQGQLSAMQAEAGLPPTFQLYDANPILVDEVIFFDGCAQCVTTGLAVVRVNPTTLRFLFARWDLEGNAWDRRLVPAEQFWRAGSSPPP